MPRIRTIKPEFPQSESVGRLSRESRLLFVLLLTGADDFGRLRAAPVLVARQLYPYDDDAPQLVPAWLDELEDHGFIGRYEVEGSRYLQILGWSKHQRVDNAGKSSIPAPPDDFAANRREPPRTAASGGDSPRSAAIPTTSIPTSTNDQRPINAKRELLAANPLPETWAPSDAQIKFAVDLGLTESEAEREATKFRAYWTSGKGAGKRRRPNGWAQAWQNWISNATERLSNGTHHANPARPNRFDASSPEAVRQRRAEIAKGLGLGLPGGGGTDHGGPVEDAA